MLIALAAEDTGAIAGEGDRLPTAGRLVRHERLVSGEEGLDPKTLRDPGRDHVLVAVGLGTAENALRLALGFRWSDFPDCVAVYPGQRRAAVRTRRADAWPAIPRRWQLEAGPLATGWTREFLDDATDEQLGINRHAEVEQADLAFAVVLWIVVLRKLRLLIGISVLDDHDPVFWERPAG